MRARLCIIEDQKLLRKFCVAMDHHYGCKRAFGTSLNYYGQCRSCPLATAEQAMWLINYKQMTMGEAVKATLHSSVTAEEAREILSDYARGKEPYPEIKPNEDEAWRKRQGEAAGRTEEDE